MLLSALVSLPMLFVAPGQCSQSIRKLFHSASVADLGEPYNARDVIHSLASLFLSHQSLPSRRLILTPNRASNNWVRLDHSRSNRVSPSMKEENETLKGDTGEVSMMFLHKAQSTDAVEGLPCIPVPFSRVLAPGIRKTLHLYDSNTLAAFRAALEQGHKVVGHVVMDAESLKARELKFMDVGVSFQILDYRPSKKSNKFNETGNSMLVDVIGVDLFEPRSVVHHYPYLNVITKSVSNSSIAASTNELAKSEASLREAFASCNSLPSFSDTVASGEDSGATIDESATLAFELHSSSRTSSFLQDVDKEEARLRMLALASTQCLSGEGRFGICKLAATSCSTLKLLESTEIALREEISRRQAMKALADAFTS